MSTPLFKPEWFVKVPLIRKGAESLTSGQKVATRALVVASMQHQIVLDKVATHVRYKAFALAVDLAFIAAVVGLHLNMRKER